MSYCPKCGNYNPDESRFCSSCGATFDAAPGYQQPPVYQQSAGYQQPNAGYQQPNAGYQQPNVGYQQPNAGYQQPNAGYHQPNAGHQANTGYQANTPYQTNPGYQQGQSAVQTKKEPKIVPIIIAVAAFMVVAIVAGVLIKSNKADSAKVPQQATSPAAAEAEPAPAEAEPAQSADYLYTPNMLCDKILFAMDCGVEAGIQGYKGYVISLDPDDKVYTVSYPDKTYVATLVFFDEYGDLVTGNEKAYGATVIVPIYGTESDDEITEKSANFTYLSTAMICAAEDKVDAYTFEAVIDSDDFINAAVDALKTGEPQVYKYKSNNTYTFKFEEMNDDGDMALGCWGQFDID